MFFKRVRQQKYKQNFKKTTPKEFIFSLPKFEEFASIPKQTQHAELYPSFHAFAKLILLFCCQNAVYNFFVTTA